jgi:hypothetical protein
MLMSLKQWADNGWLRPHQTCAREIVKKAVGVLAAISWTSTSSMENCHPNFLILPLRLDNIYVLDHSLFAIRE